MPPILRYTEQNRFGRALLTMFWNFIFYGMIAVGAILFVSLTIYRIDWARHPEKYKDLVEDEDPQKAEYRKKKEADKTYEELQNVLEEQKQAKERYDSRHEAVQAAHEVLAGIEAKLDGMKKNQVEGIGSLKKLDAAIEKLAGEIEEFSNKKARLEAVEKTAREHATKQNARIVPARREADAAREKLLKAEK
ncbi:MAG: hypothetical protein SPJ28_02845, partial [Oscillospiraceae bacterium]|nr:hypothetical protein [Oscillospiraceae bacterium]